MPRCLAYCMMWSKIDIVKNNTNTVSDSGFSFDPRSRHVDHWVHVTHFITELKICHRYSLNIHDDFYSADPGSMQGDGHIWTQLNDLALHAFSHWIEHPPGVRKVMGSISVGDSDFLFVPSSSHVDQFAFHFSTTLSFRFCEIVY